MFNCLELFSGTGSFKKEAQELDYNVLSIDLLLKADIQIDIMEWDYKKYDKNSFDIIWASPPCTAYSILQGSWIGRHKKIDGEYKLFTEEQRQKDMNEADKIVLKTLEIINYFNPHLWFLENPLGNLRHREIMKNIPYYIVDYCKYSDWGYRKRTCIWTNKKDWKALTCNKDCGNIIEGKHKNNLGNDVFKKDGVKVSENYNKLLKYRVPPNLIFSLLTE